MDLDQIIPKELRLDQYAYDPDTYPKQFPVFLKPEWGQNSKGILYAECEKDIDELKDRVARVDVQYIVQEAIKFQQEYEIFFLRCADDPGRYASFSITRVDNSGSEDHPINSVHNPETHYYDVTGNLSDAEKEILWQRFEKIGEFKMARFGVKTDSFSTLVEQQFKIFEINVYLPMPLVLLAENVENSTKFHLIGRLMNDAARLVRTIQSHEIEPWIFFKKLKAHYKVAK